MNFNFNFKDIPPWQARSIRLRTTACDWDHSVGNRPWMAIGGREATELRATV